MNNLVVHDVNLTNHINITLKKTIPYAGGLAIIASALKGMPESISSSLQAGSREKIISLI